MSRFRINTESEIILSLLKTQNFGRAIAKISSIPLTNVQRAIANLESNNILEYSTQGKNKMYSLKKSLAAKSAVITAEQYKLTKIITKYPYLEPMLKDILSVTDKQIILFGSHAKCLAKIDSDVDIFIETKDLKLKENIESSNSRLSVKIGALSKADLLSKEIIADHVIIRGIEKYYDKFPWKD